MSLGKMACSFWGKVKDECEHIFYRKPLVMLPDRGLEYHHLKTTYTYFSIVVLALYGIPWGALAVWRVAVKGCESHVVRSYLDATCMQPYFSPGNRIPWYLDLWDSQASMTNHLDPLSPSIEAIMISHLPMYDAEMALLQQIWKLQDLPSDIMAADELLTSLGKSHVFPNSKFNPEKVAHHSGTDEVKQMASKLAPQLNSFSYRFCIEKDIMTHVLRTFTEAYAVTITTSNHKDMTISSVLIFPAIHLLRFINQYTLISWLPEPKLYSLQVKAEIRFQKRRFIHEMTAALDRIDASSPGSRYSNGTTTQTQLLEAAIKTVAIYQQKLTQKIHESASFPWRWIYKAKHTVTLEGFHALSERIRRRILVIKETTQVYEIHFGRLRDEIQNLRQSFDYSPSFEFSPTDLIAVPAPLLAQIPVSRLLSRQQSSRTDNTTASNGSGIPDITPHGYVYFYDRDWIDDTRISTLRSEVAQLCEDRENTKMVSGNLYMVCLIYSLAATMSELDSNGLSSVQRSWAVVRREAIRRYEWQTGVDQESIVNLVLDIDQAQQQGIPVPGLL